MLPIRVLLFEIALICIIVALAPAALAIAGAAIALIGAVAIWIVMAGIAIALFIYAGPLIAIGIGVVTFICWLFSISWKNNDETNEQAVSVPKSSNKSTRDNFVLFVAISTIIALTVFFVAEIFFTIKPTKETKKSDEDVFTSLQEPLSKKQQPPYSNFIKL